MQFTVADGFEIELVAMEPLISDPVDMEIDENGDWYVVEMHGYPLDVSGSGVVKKLVDTDGDGLPDQSKVFADHLVLPTSIMRWKNGFLVTDAPDVLYLEDSNGDGKADIREAILTGFARSNPQHNLNSPVYGLDNWIYLGHENDVFTVMFDSLFQDRGNEIIFPNKENSQKLRVNALGKSVRLKPDKGLIEMLASKTQFGHDFDDFGRLFMASNSHHIYQEIFQNKYIQRKPEFSPFLKTQYIPEHGNNAEVFPTTRNAEHQLLTDVGVFTSACGITLYNGQLFPEAYHGVAFVAEPVHNLVHADQIVANGIPDKAVRMLENAEFLSSEDPWFRPVNFYVGPDGALYVLDYYRKIIEHPEWMAEEVINSGSLYDGIDKGRIYRIKPKGDQLSNVIGKPLIDKENIDELVTFLDSPNKWYRTNAQRIIVQNGLTKAGNLIRESLAIFSDVGIVHALWTLEGLEELNTNDLRPFLKHKAEGVQENAIKLTELFPDSVFAQDLIALSNQKKPKRVEFQLALTLGNRNSSEAKLAVKNIFLNNLSDEFIALAALSSPYFDAGQLIADFPKLPETVLAPVAYLNVDSGNHSDLIEMIELCEKNIIQEWTQAVLSGIVTRMQVQSENIEGELIQHVFSGFEKAKGQRAQEWFRLLEFRSNDTGIDKEVLLKLIHSDNVSPEKKAYSVLLYPDDDNPSDLLEMMKPGYAMPVQQAVVQWYSKHSKTDAEFYNFVFENWSEWSPAIRNSSIDELMKSDQRMMAVLNQIDAGLIDHSVVGWRRSVRLMNHRESSVKTLARRLLAVYGIDHRLQDMQHWKPIVEKTGDGLSGQVLFEKHCSQCHQVGGENGTKYGPDLASVRNQDKLAILNHIVNPELSISDGYELWQITLNSNEEVQGVINFEDEFSITISPSPGNERLIQRKNIIKMYASEYSAMPPGFGKILSQQEMADLLEFIKYN